MKKQEALSKKQKVLDAVELDMRRGDKRLVPMIPAIMEICEAAYDCGYRHRNEEAFISVNKNVVIEAKINAAKKALNKVEALAISDMAATDPPLILSKISYIAIKTIKEM